MMNTDPHQSLAAAIRRALIDAAESAYEDAGIRGLCEEGRWEAAVSAMRALDVEAVARQAASSTDPHPSAGSPTHPSHG